MGTNYYWHRVGPEDCVCGVPVHDVVHIGKSSAGWAFCFRVYDDPDASYQIPDSQAWRELMANRVTGVILDEYGRKHSVEDFWAMVDAPERKAMMDDRTCNTGLADYGLVRRDFRDAHGHRCYRGEFS